MESNEAQATFSVELSESDLQLVRTGLKLLEDTLGREESEELEDVQALLDRLPEANPRD